MIDLDIPTVMVQWAAGGWVFLWVTTRHREVGLGYGWLMRGVFVTMAIIGILVGTAFGFDAARESLTALFVVVGTATLASSILRRKAGVAGQREVTERRSERVASMTGIDRDVQVIDKAAIEFDPRLDAVAAAVGLVAVVAAGINSADGEAAATVLLAVARALVGALFLGAVSDAMLLGHWYLVQPGLARGPLLELVKWTGWLWAPEVLVMVLPTGMFSALSGTIDDGYNGLLGWFWVASVITTIGLVFVTRAALKERYYSAVMAATGLLYLAILTGFGMDLVARAVLAP